ncbi:MAG: DMT family transporter [Solirubrobacterales bacterium]|nr:DMT family transporter [Solirubrobacterales bacterium]
MARARSSASTVSPRLVGLALGALGVLGFSFSLPATKLAVGSLDPWFVAFGRAVAAAALAGFVLVATRARRPSPTQWRRLGIVALGVVVGFPLFTSIALETSGSAHGAVVIAVLPAATAVAAVARAGERPGRLFWAGAIAGVVVVGVFALAYSSGAFTAADLWLLLAVVTCAIGYAEGGALARELGGARTICWALLLSLPLTLPVALLSADGLAGASREAWLGFAYVCLVSMFLGFFAWYAGLARGGVARVSQVQLAQPLLTLLWSALLLGEYVGPGTLLAAVAVLACVLVTQRSRVGGERTSA